MAQKGFYNAEILGVVSGVIGGITLGASALLDPQMLTDIANWTGIQELATNTALGASIVGGISAAALGATTWIGAKMDNWTHNEPSERAENGLYNERKVTVLNAIVGGITGMVASLVSPELRESLANLTGIDQLADQVVGTLAATGAATALGAGFGKLGAKLNNLSINRGQFGPSPA